LILLISEKEEKGGRNWKIRCFQCWRWRKK